MPLDHYHALGRAGLRVSRLALGAMTFGTEWGGGAADAIARAISDRYRGTDGVGATARHGHHDSEAVG